VLSEQLRGERVGQVVVLGRCVTSGLRLSHILHNVRAGRKAPIPYFERGNRDECDDGKQDSRRKGGRASEIVQRSFVGLLML